MPQDGDDNAIEPDNAWSRQRAWVGRVLQVEVAKLRTVALPKKYAEEDKRLGFRVDLDADDVWEQRAREWDEKQREKGRTTTTTAEQMKRRFAASDLQVTDYYDDARREASKVSFDAAGGAQLKGGTQRPADGKMVQVLSPEGELHAVPEGMRKASGGKYIATHHSTPLAGGEVAGAGFVEFKDGHITEVNNQSGHYKPDTALLHQEVGVLDAAGGLRDRRLVDAAGTPLPPKLIASLSPAARQAALAYAAALQRRDRALDAERAALQAEVLKAEADMHVAGAAALEEMSPEDRKARGLAGAGPANREAKVSALGADAMLTPEQMRALGAEPPERRKAAAAKIIRQNILAERLGEAEFAQITSELTVIATIEAALSAGGRRLAEEMKRQGLDTPNELAKMVAARRAALGVTSLDALQDELGTDSIPALKAALGKRAVAGLGPGAGLEDAFAAHNIPHPTMDPTHFNTATVNFDAGKAAAQTLPASAFLQTEGNMSQIRNKAALLDEIQAGADLRWTERGAFARIPSDAELAAPDHIGKGVPAASQPAPPATAAPAEAAVGTPAATSSGTPYAVPEGMAGAMPDLAGDDQPGGPPGAGGGTPGRAASPDRYAMPARAEEDAAENDAAENDTEGDDRDESVDYDSEDDDTGGTDGGASDPLRGTADGATGYAMPSDPPPGDTPPVTTAGRHPGPHHTTTGRRPPG